VDLYEYQGRDMFERHGLPVLAGGVATTPDEARAIAERLGGRVVVKAQVKVGGRGKAGGVKLAGSPDEAREVAGAILGMDIKGFTVRKVLVGPAADIVQEFYLSAVLDRASRRIGVSTSRGSVAALAMQMKATRVPPETRVSWARSPAPAVRRGPDDRQKGDAA